MTLPTILSFLLPLIFCGVSGQNSVDEALSRLEERLGALESGLQISKSDMAPRMREMKALFRVFAKGVPPCGNVSGWEDLSDAECFRGLEPLYTWEEARKACEEQFTEGVDFQMPTLIQVESEIEQANLLQLLALPSFIGAVGVWLGDRKAGNIPRLFSPPGFNVTDAHCIEVLNDDGVHRGRSVATDCDRKSKAICVKPKALSYSNIARRMAVLTPEINAAMRNVTTLRSEVDGVKWIIDQLKTNVQNTTAGFLTFMNETGEQLDSSNFKIKKMEHNLIQVKKAVDSGKTEREIVRRFVDQLSGKDDKNAREVNSILPSMQIVNATMETAKTEIAQMRTTEEALSKTVKEIGDYAKLEDLKMWRFLNASALAFKNLLHVVAPMATTLYQLQLQRNETREQLRDFLNRVEANSVRFSSLDESVKFLNRQAGAEKATLQSFVAKLGKVEADLNSTSELAKSNAFDCGGVLVKDSGSLEFESPYLLKFNYTCVWTIRTGFYQFVNVTLVEENFSVSKSKLRIMSQDGLLHNSYNGTGASLGQIEWGARSQGSVQRFNYNTVFVVLVMDGGERTRPKFRLSFTGTGNSINLSSRHYFHYHFAGLSGIVENLQHRDYERSSYVIAPKASSPYRSVTLFKNIIGLEAGLDWLRVWGIGSQSLLGSTNNKYTFTGFANATTFETVTDELGWIVVFRSDENTRWEGYSLGYVATTRVDPQKLD